MFSSNNMKGLVQYRLVLIVVIMLLIIGRLDFFCDMIYFFDFSVWSKCNFCIDVWS